MTRNHTYLDLKFKIISATFDFYLFLSHPKQLEHIVIFAQSAKTDFLVYIANDFSRIVNSSLYL